MISVLLFGQLIWNIPLLLVMSAITILYLLLLGKKDVLFKPIHPILFLLGIWLLYVAIGSPLLAISYLSFSFHMIQMSFLYFIIPPLILLGIPQTLYEKVTKPFPKKKYPIRLSPKIALISFAVLFLLYHLPFILTIISVHSNVQKLLLSLLFLLSFRMWWPIAAPNSKERLIHAARKRFVLQSSLYIMPACMMFIFSAFLDGTGNPLLGQVAVHLCLPADNTIQILPAAFHTKYDQMFAGVFMLGIHKIGLQLTCKLEEKC